jgi:hypothetical protein
MAVAFRDVVTDPNSQRLPHRQIAHGMKLPEVEAILGCKGEPQGGFITGSMDYWAKHEYYKHRWEDPYTTIDVSFQGPRGAATVVHIDRRAKNPPDLVRIWRLPIGLALLALTGVSCVVHGLRPRNARDRLNSPTTSDRKDGEVSPS